MRPPPGGGLRRQTLDGIAASLLQRLVRCAPVQLVAGCAHPQCNLPAVSGAPGQGCHDTSKAGQQSVVSCYLEGREDQHALSCGASQQFIPTDQGCDRIHRDSQPMCDLRGVVEGPDELVERVRIVGSLRIGVDISLLCRSPVSHRGRSSAAPSGVFVHSILGRPPALTAQTTGVMYWGCGCG